MNKIIFFWKENKNNGYLSNWYKSEFLYQLIKYKTVEHYLMAQKARLFNDNLVYEKIIKAYSPAQAKLLGKQVSNFNNDIWINHRETILKRGLYLKFSQNIELKTKLVNTKGHILAEASPNDLIYGGRFKRNRP